MIGEDSGWVAESEFVEGFDELIHGHREGDDFWVVDGAEELLDLLEGGEGGEIWSCNPGGGVGHDEVDGVAGDEGGLGGEFEEFGDYGGGFGVFAEVADDDNIIGLVGGGLEVGEGDFAEAAGT